MKIIKVVTKDIQKSVKEAVGALRKGKVIVCPTDTVYGLVADATNKKAVQKIFKIKKRPAGKPIPIFVANIQMAKRYAKISPSQELFLKKVWPGRVTLVLDSKNRLPHLLGTFKTIGLRIPKYPFISLIFKKFKRPLTGTSANLSGVPASGNIKDVLSQFQNKKYTPDLVFDAGRLPRPRPSKIIDITGPKKKILRK